MKLEILEVPNPILKQKSKEILVVDDEIRALASGMFDLIYSNNGLGLTAIQVGVPLRMFVMDDSRKEGERNQRVLINPEIIWRSEELESNNEGCLSVPGVRANVTRNKRVEIKYFDLDMKEHRLKFDDDYLSACLQHEIDHMNGVLYIDYLSKLKRDNLMDKVQKFKKFK